MLSDTLLCPICLVEFKDKTCVPKQLVNCSHNICETCLTQILHNMKGKKCPVCAKKFPDTATNINNFQTNLTILQVLERLNCPVHNIQRKLYCIQDFEETCEKCIQRQHKGHEVITINELRSFFKLRSMK